MVSQLKRIVFYRIGAIGDIIHTLPLLALTRELNPQARIEYIVGSKQVAELLEKYAGYIDKVHAIKHKGIFDKPFRFLPTNDEKDLVASFNESPVDEFYYLHGNQLKAKVLNSRVIKAKKLFVYKRDDSLSAVSNYVSCRYPDLKADLLENPYRVLKSNTLSLRANAKQSPCPDKNISIVLGVGAMRPSRAYPLIKWIKFIEYLLVNTKDYKINILGGPDELELSTEFEETLARRKETLHYGWFNQAPDFSRVNNLIGKTSLVELAEILKNTDRLFSADTGILHIAAAVDTPITSIFSITSEKRFGPFKKDAKVLRSSKCQCALSFSNLPKHCEYPCQKYAKCMFDIDLLASNDKLI
jgi:ADP-heptose:LPS heptosyltransferase